MYITAINNQQASKAKPSFGYKLPPREVNEYLNGAGNFGDVKGTNDIFTRSISNIAEDNPLDQIQHIRKQVQGNTAEFTDFCNRLRSNQEMLLGAFQDKKNYQEYANNIMNLPGKQRIILLESLSNESLLKLFSSRANYDGDPLIKYASDKINIFYYDFSDDVVKKISQIEDAKGRYTISLNGKQRKRYATHFKDDPEFLAKLINHRDADGNNTLYLDNKNPSYSYDMEDIKDYKESLSILRRSLYEEDLVKALTNRNKDGYTAFTQMVKNIKTGTHDESYHKRAAQVLKNFIVDIATNSFLSMEESVKILEENEIEPSLIKYLKSFNPDLKTQLNWDCPSYLEAAYEKYIAKDSKHRHL
ncbi:MAG: hypothetical protein NC191_07830 [Muribaculaceae bacterium]|nr:hypothetical protein [Muribaculaceae bacterium]